MAGMDKIKMTAWQVWPYAAHVDIMPSTAGQDVLNDPYRKGFRLSAIHPDGTIMGQVIADDLKELEARVKEKLNG